MEAKFWAVIRGGTIGWSFEDQNLAKEKVEKSSYEVIFHSKWLRKHYKGFRLLQNSAVKLQNNHYYTQKS